MVGRCVIFVLLIICQKLDKILSIRRKKRNISSIFPSTGYQWYILRFSEIIITQPTSFSRNGNKQNCVSNLFCQLVIMYILLCVKSIHIFYTQGAPFTSQSCLPERTLAAFGMNHMVELTGLVYNNEPRNGALTLILVSTCCLSIKMLQQFYFSLSRVKSAADTILRLSSYKSSQSTEYSQNISNILAKSSL